MAVVERKSARDHVVVGCVDEVVCMSLVLLRGITGEATG